MELFFPVMRYKRYCFRGIRNLSVEIFRIISAFIIIILQDILYHNNANYFYDTLGHLGQMSIIKYTFKASTSFSNLVDYPIFPSCPMLNIRVSILVHLYFTTFVLRRVF